MHTFLSLRTIQISVPSPQPTCASSDTPARRPFRAARRRWASPRKPKRTAPVRPDLMRPHASRPHRRGAHSQPQKSWGYNARHRCLSAHRLHRPRGPAAHGRRRLHLQTVRPRRTCRPCRRAASQAHGRGRHISQRAGQRAAGSRGQRSTHLQQLAPRPLGHTFTVDALPFDLTPIEFKLIATLMAHPQRAFSKQELFEAAWGEPYTADDNTVTVHISNIRAKLRPTGTDGYIKTVWGMGFKLQEPA